MCLAIPGKIISFEDVQSEMKIAKVSFGGVIKSVCMDLLPEAEIGNYVLVHVGFALNTIDEQEAEETLKMLTEIEQ
ncbi:MAG: HypC/HybG/HupF family hydrogenase formation chaperone [FCB group bacterium]|jgi:hydrogenase expression/formation protein HypC